jgi:hypothetical protein
MSEVLSVIDTLTDEELKTFTDEQILQLVIQNASLQNIIQRFKSSAFHC